MLSTFRLKAFATLYEFMVMQIKLVVLNLIKSDKAENFDLSFATLRWGFLFVLFFLQFRAWIIYNNQKHKQWKTFIEDKKWYFGWHLISR